jgi:hypothetical protein
MFETILFIGGMVGAFAIGYWLAGLDRVQSNPYMEDRIDAARFDHPQDLDAGTPDGWAKPSTFTPRVSKFSPPGEPPRHAR